MAVKHGKQTWSPGKTPVIVSTGTVTGPTEAQGPLGKWFDHQIPGSAKTGGQNSFEDEEKQMMLMAAYAALQKASKTPEDVDLYIAGDLLNQIITSGYSASDLGIPYLGIYGACSTAAEGLVLSTAFIDAGFANLVLTAAASHNSTAERQYRYPTEYGAFRKPYTQWTVTGAGAALLAPAGRGAAITYVTVGIVKDLGISDPLNMGAAMAPAAAATLNQHFFDTGRKPADYDLIVTGDLGRHGHELLLELTAQTGFDLNPNSRDCGAMIYDPEKQDVHSGGSGAAASAVVTYGYLYSEMREHRLKRVLLCGTGALHSPTSVMQGNSIPGIAHAVSLEWQEG